MVDITDIIVEASKVTSAYKATEPLNVLETNLTIVIDSNGRVHNIAAGEHPTVVWADKKAGIVKSGLPKNAFVCTEEEYVKLMKERGQVIKAPKKEVDDAQLDNG